VERWWRRLREGLTRRWRRLRDTSCVHRKTTGLLVACWSYRGGVERGLVASRRVGHRRLSASVEEDLGGGGVALAAALRQDLE
jgi:hypothetical protein